MGYRIGIASSDGIVINQHFGRAADFLIVDTDEAGEFHFVEKRAVTPVCEGGNHDEKRLLQNVERLSDCDYILVSRIGPGAANVLEEHGILVYEIPGMLEEAVKKLLVFQQVRELLL